MVFNFIQKNVFQACAVKAKIYKTRAAMENDDDDALKASSMRLVNARGVRRKWKLKILQNRRGEIIQMRIAE